MIIIDYLMLFISSPFMLYDRRPLIVLTMNTKKTDFFILNHDVPLRYLTIAQTDFEVKAILCKRACPLLQSKQVNLTL